MPQKIRLKLRADLTSKFVGQLPASISVGPAGELIVLLVDAAAEEALRERDEQPGWASFPRSRTRRPVNATMLRYDDTGASHTPLSDVALAFPRLQPLPGGETLVVGTRCHRLEDGTAERNAQVFGMDGSLRREFVLGDGIEDVQATPTGEFWVSYFDEGVIGNYGWGGKNAPPVGAPGLVRFNGNGVTLWEFSPPYGLGPIDDYYALNVDGETAWAYYYSDFPLVHITSDGQIRGWQSGVSGARAIVTDGRRILLFGGYSPNPFRCLLGRLGATEIVDLREVTLLLPDGQPIDSGDVAGRGQTLHVFVEAGWYQLDLRDIW